MKRRAVVLMCSHEPVETTARVLGCVALHRTVGDRRAWTVTHEPTGYAFAQSITREQDARDLAERLDVILGGDLDFRNVSAYAGDLRDRIRAVITEWKEERT